MIQKLKRHVLRTVSWPNLSLLPTENLCVFYSCLLFLHVDGSEY